MLCACVRVRACMYVSARACACLRVLGCQCLATGCFPFDASLPTTEGPSLESLPTTSGPSLEALDFEYIRAQARLACVSASISTYR